MDILVPLMVVDVYKGNYEDFFFDEQDLNNR